MSAWPNSYVGLPYLDLGRERGGCDCWGLACVVYREVLGIRLPDYLGYASAQERGEVAAVVAHATASPLWLRQEGPGSPFNIAVFRRGNLDTHVGIVVLPGLMLHMALRIKATHQLNGQIDTFNARVERLCLDWDFASGTWVQRTTSNPASLYRHVLQSPANPRPVAIGASVVRTVRTDPGQTNLLVVQGDGDLPAPGDLILFGTATAEAWPMIVSGVEAGQEMSSLMRLVDAAPIIDELLGADTIPAWSGRVGAEIDDNVLQPPAPRFLSISSGVSGTETEDRIDYLIAPGSSSIPTALFEIDHRLVGAGVWSTVDIPAAEGGGTLTDYVNGDVVEMQAHAVSPTGVAGPATPVVSFTVGGGDAAIPDALASVTTTVLLGAVRLTIAASADAAATEAQVYRAPAGVALDRSTHALGAPIATTPASSVSYVDGDSTRVNLIGNGDFSGTSDWTLGAAWAYSSGKALHTAGTADALSQAMPITAGKWYRLSYVISGRTAGTLQPSLTGGTDRPGALRASNGVFADRIQAVTGNTTLTFLADLAFDGAIDAVTIWEETPAALAQGSYDYYAEALNDDGLPGPPSGPFGVQID